MESNRPRHVYVRPQYQISAYDEETLRLEKYGGWIGRSLTVLRVITRILTFTSSFGLAGTSLYDYYSTVNETAANQTPWTSDTTLWPQIITLIFGIILLILNAIVVFAYCWGGKAADRMDSWKNDVVNYFPRFLDVLHTVFPMSVTISMLSTASTSNSLQSQSCAAPSPSPVFPTINFSGICTKQVFIQYMALVHAALGYLSGLTNVSSWFEKRYKEKMDKHKAEAPRPDFDEI